MSSVNPTALQTPWHLSPSLYQRLPTLSNLAYRTCLVTSQDLEWNLIHRLFQLYKPDKYSIATIHCVHNSALVNQFQASIVTQEQEAQSTHFAPNGRRSSPSELRQKVIQRWTTLTPPYNPFSIQWPNQRKDVYTHTKVLPLWHGTKVSSSASICTTGLTTFGKHEIIHGATQNTTQNTDIGYFGSGIYFTTSAKYAASIYSDGSLLLAWVSLREPYPVVADQLCSPPHKPSDMQKLEGLGAYQNYNAHYIPVISVNPSDPNCTIYYPCTASQTPAWDEIVVFQKSQALPSFWIQLQPDFLTTPTAATINHLVDHLLLLLDRPAIQSDPALNQLLDQKCQQLAALNLHDPLTSLDQEFYNWSLKLFDEAGKVRNYVQQKLQQTKTHPSSIPPNIGVVQPTPAIHDFTSAVTSVISQRLSQAHSSPIPINASSQFPSMTDLTQTLSQSTLPSFVTQALNAAGRGKALIRAIDEGNVEAITYLLSQEVLLNEKDGMGRTPLVMACEKKNSEILSLLIRNGAPVDGEDARGALITATQNTDREIVKILVTEGVPMMSKQGPRPNRVYSDAATPCIPLEIVATNGDIELLEFFISTMNRPNGVNLGAAGHQGSDKYYCKSVGIYAVELALGKGHLKVAQMLVENGVGVKDRVSHDSSVGDIVLNAACARGDFMLINLLLKKGHALSDADGWFSAPRALNRAQHCDHFLKLARLLIENGLNLNYNLQPSYQRPESIGSVVFLAACKANDIELVRLLLEKKINLGESFKESYNNETIRQVALRYNNEATRLLPGNAMWYF